MASNRSAFLKTVDVALVTYGGARALTADDDLLRAALQNLGLRVIVARWDDPRFQVVRFLHCYSALNLGLLSADRRISALAFTSLVAHKASKFIQSYHLEPA